MNRFLSLTILITLSFFAVSAQDTLPKFTVKNLGNKRIVVSWKNNYEVVKQISIQRSPDSLKNFKTIMSVTDPTAKENGFADTKAPTDRQFYRLFIVLDKGGFLFSEAKKPFLDSSLLVKPKPPVSAIDSSASNVTVNTQPEDTASPSARLDNSKTDKLNLDTKNPSIGNRDINSNKPRPDVYVPSMHVYTYKDGNVRIILPDNDEKKYSIKFFEEDNSFVFEIKDIKQTPVLLDKSNFYHAGWFKFELYADGKLIEKNKFKISKDF